MEIYNYNYLPDIQNTHTEGFYKIPINKVGVRNIKIPIKILRKDGSICDTIATISSYCDLDANRKGINMSRIANSIFQYAERISIFDPNAFKKLAEILKDAHDAKNIYFKCYFPYLYKIKTPITNIDSWEAVEVVFEIKLLEKEVKGIKYNTFTHYLTVKTTEISLCPCSKEMSLLENNLTEEEEKWLDEKLYGEEAPPIGLIYKIKNAGFGAHNQKSEISVTIEYGIDNIVYIEDLLKIIQESVSAQTFSVLKRPDEKWVTEVSYMGKFINDKKELVTVEGNYGAKFVEDIARDIVKNINNYNEKNKLDDENLPIKDYVIVVCNKESIHSSDIEAIAVINAGKNLF